MPFLPLRLALREMRGGLRGFRILLACLALGVAAIGGAASLNESVQAGIAANARPLLGGDLQARFSGAPATTPELQAMQQGNLVSSQMQLRSMARTEDAAGTVGKRSLIELKVVDDAYPLYGDVVFNPAQNVKAVLGQSNGIWGAAIDEALLSRLGIAVGDTIKIGEAAFQVRGVIAKEPDRLLAPTISGPQVMVALDAMPATALVQEGSLLTYVYNIRIGGTETAGALRARLRRAFPGSAWRLRGVNQAAQGLEGFLDNVTLFLTLVGMTALLTGGIGVANAVTAYLNGRMATIAILKVLGAPARTIFLTYAIQVAMLSSVGIVIGLIVAAVIPPLVFPFIADLLPVAAKLGIYPRALAQAAIFGVLTAAVFGLWPLARARDIPPIALFRNMLAAGQRPRLRYLIVLGCLATALAVFAVVTAEERRFAAYFVLGAIAALAVFRLAALLVMKAASRLGTGRNSPAVGQPSLRLALANLYRPGAPTTSVVLSLGLGLSVLVAIALLQTNLNTRIANGVPGDTPSMFIIDIQPQQLAAFTDMVTPLHGVNKVITAPMIRGRISKINGIDVDDARIDPDARWAVRGERGLSYAATAPENAHVVKGTWWPSDYSGENLVSLDVAVANGMHLRLGDTVSVDVLGRDVTAKIANLRDIRWQSAAMNFAFIFSPNALVGAPAMNIATINADAGAEDGIEQTVIAAMPNVTVIQVREALEMLRGLLGSLAIAVRLTASVALAGGVLVLAGAIAAGHGRRIYEAVVLKVLGATRMDVLRAFVFEYCLLGLATGVIAAGVGALAAWSIVTRLMHIPWELDFEVVGEIIVGCVLVTLMAGFSGTWRALGVKAAPLLRND